MPRETEVVPPRPTLTVVIPLRDEAAGIAELARCWRRFVAAEPRIVDLVLVDDGSTDGTLALLHEHFAALPVTIRRHEVGLGLTAALATGLDAARGALVGFLDADLTYDPELLSVLADAVEQGADLALASCYHPGGAVDGVPRWRLGLSRLASAGYRLVSRVELHTFTCMVRVGRREQMVACVPRAGGFAGVTEALLLALRRGARVVEVPATLRRRRTGVSKLRVLRAAWAHLVVMARCAGQGGCRA